MGKTQHTPGPWTIETESDIYGGFSKIVNKSGDLILDNNLYDPSPPKEDDFNLIAAAPDLLEALEGLRDQQERMIHAGGADGPMDDDMILSFAKSNQVLWEKAEAAIAKAKGLGEGGE